jgi:hypothetical protein
VVCRIHHYLDSHARPCRHRMRYAQSSSPPGGCPYATRANALPALPQSAGDSTEHPVTTLAWTSSAARSAKACSRSPRGFTFRHASLLDDEDGDDRRHAVLTVAHCVHRAIAIEVEEDRRRPTAAGASDRRRSWNGEPRAWCRGHVLDERRAFA